MIQVFQTNFPPQNTPVVDTKGTMTNAGMAFFRALFNRTGQDTGLVNQVNTAVTGGDLLADWNVLLIGSAAVNLPALTGGQMIMVQNTDPGPVSVLPPAGATIDGTGIYSLAGTKMQIFWFVSATQIFSTQL